VVVLDLLALDLLLTSRHQDLAPDHVLVTHDPEEQGHPDHQLDVMVRMAGLRLANCPRKLRVWVL
jgi:LmbE family N-acetylglucosaminyl deacetylase